MAEVKREHREAARLAMHPTAHEPEWKIERVAQAIADAESRGAESAGAWIPCSERLPDPDTEVLVWVSDWDDEASPEIGELGESGTWYVISDGEALVENVTHWMPFPAPPAPTKESK